MWGGIRKREREGSPHFRKEEGPPGKKKKKFGKKKKELRKKRAKPGGGLVHVLYGKKFIHNNGPQLRRRGPTASFSSQSAARRKNGVGEKETFNSKDLRGTCANG